MEPQNGNHPHPDHRLGDAVLAALGEIDRLAASAATSPTTMTVGTWPVSMMWSVTEARLPMAMASQSVWVPGAATLAVAPAGRPSE